MTNLLSKAWVALALPVALFALWFLASAGSTTFFFPPLSRILEKFAQLWLSDRFVVDVLPSVGRLLLGYLIAVVAGIVIGILLGLSRRVRVAAEPVLEFFRAIPPPVLVPVLMLLMGFGDTMKIIVIVTGCIWPILLNTVEGVKGHDSVIDDTCRTFQIRGFARIWHFILPSATPQIMAGMRTGLSIGIILMVISEMFAATSGLGAAIIQFQRSFQIAEMWSGVLVLGIIGFVLSMLFQLVEKRVLGWYHGMKDLERQNA